MCPLPEALWGEKGGDQTNEREIGEVTSSPQRCQSISYTVQVGRCSFQCDYDKNGSCSLQPAPIFFPYMKVLKGLILKPGIKICIMNANNKCNITTFLKEHIHSFVYLFIYLYVCLSLCLFVFKVNFLDFISCNSSYF